MKTFVASCAALTLAAVVLPAAATAGTVVDTGAPTHSSNHWSVYRNASPFEFQNLAAQFTLAQATTITDLEGFIAAPAGTFSVSLATSAGSPAQPNAQFFLQQATTAATSGDWEGLHGLNLSLAAGSYWLIFSSRTDLGDSINNFTMADNAPNPIGPEAMIHIPVDGDWVRNDALNIGVRVFDNTIVPGGVPEPASWTLMISGFGLAGAAMRRRRAVAA